MRYLCLAALAIALTGCDVTNTSTTPLPTSDRTGPSSPSTRPIDSPSAPSGGTVEAPGGVDSDATRTKPGSSGPVRPDNTGVNERDRDSTAKTPIDQDENTKDVQITADIRKQILATEGMSVNARNSKIITSQGRVTLRGPVDSEDEKTKVEKIAANVAGKENVTSELEVAK